MVIWGQIFILDIAGWRRASMWSLLKQTESKVKDKDLTPFLGLAIERLEVDHGSEK
jgi:hypothetical protein